MSKNKGKNKGKNKNTDKDVLVERPPMKGQTSKIFVIGKQTEEMVAKKLGLNINDNENVRTLDDMKRDKADRLEQRLVEIAEDDPSIADDIMSIMEDDSVLSDMYLEVMNAEKLNDEVLTKIQRLATILETLVQYSDASKHRIDSYQSGLGMLEEIVVRLEVDPAYNPKVTPIELRDEANRVLSQYNGGSTVGLPVDNVSKQEEPKGYLRVFTRIKEETRLPSSIGKPLTDVRPIASQRMMEKAFDDSADETQAAIDRLLKAKENGYQEYKLTDTPLRKLFRNPFSRGKKKTGII